MHAEARNLPGGDPASFLGLGAVLAWMSAEHLGVEADGELLSDLAVVVGHDVAGVGVDAHEPGQSDDEAGLFADLTDGRVSDGLPEVHTTAWHGPIVAIDLVNEQEPGLLGSVSPDKGGYLAQWTDGVGQRHREHLNDEGTAVKLVARSQAGGLRFHDLRHSYATWLVDDGVPPNMVQRVLGHERASTTLDLYTRRTDESSRILRALDDEDGSAGALVPA